MLAYLSKIQPFLYRTYIALAVLFAMNAIVFVIVGPIEITYISLLGLAWSLVGIIINSGYLIKREK